MYRPHAIAAAAVFAALVSGAPARAEMITYGTDLKGAMEVPPNATKGVGDVEATLDTATRKFTYTINYSGITGPATAAHFHGPAAPGVNAPPIVPINGDLKSPIKGEATLTEAQVKDMQDGKVYFNVHTADNKGGEIRGQLIKK